MELTERQKKMRRWLIAVAAGRGTVPYSEVGERFGIEEGYKWAEVAREVGAISEYEIEHERPMLSVVVVHKEDGFPGEGFFTWALDLGRMKRTKKDPKNKVEFFVDELKAAHDYWSKQTFKIKIGKASA
jgi:hypothetical protein